jgi:hypothetical protein
MTALCLGLGWWSQGALKQKRAVEVLRSIGANVRYDIDVGEFGYETASARVAPPGRIETNLGIDYVHNVAMVFLVSHSSPFPKDEVLNSLRCFPRLRFLYLYARDLTDDDLAAICKQGELESLKISIPGVTPPGLRHLRDLKILTKLELQEFALNEDAAVEIAQLTGLTRLSISPHQVEVDGLATIATMRGLNELRVFPDDPITDEQVACLASMSQLHALSLSPCFELSDESFERLAGMNGLRRLSLGNLKLNERKIAALATMQGLKGLELWSDGADHEPIDLNPLRQALPNCPIETDLRP